MSFADWYFKRFNTSEPTFSNDIPCAGMVVVIPAYQEEGIIDLLTLLWNAKMPKQHVVVLVIVNHAQSASKEVIETNSQTIKDLEHFKSSVHNSNISLFYHLQVFNDKYAGVGSARKLGMDQAIRWFNFHDKKDGIIVSLDADVSIEINYLQEIENHFYKYPDNGVAILRFEHPLQTEEFPVSTINAITLYELYLRYFRLSLEWCGYPFALPTIGSCFSVIAEAYIRAGGMNRKQGGEDFYFLHKLTAFTPVGQINTTCVKTSQRASDRVPFGTGPEVQKIMNSGELLTYNPEIFSIIKEYLSSFPLFYHKSTSDVISILYGINPILAEFARETGFEVAHRDAIKHSASQTSFVKRIMRHADAFKIVRFLNFASNTYPKIKVQDAAQQMLAYYSDKKSDNANVLLDMYRRMELVDKI